MLGINPTTVRRRIKEGKLRAARVERPQGYTLRVLLDDAELPRQQVDPPRSTCTCAHLGPASSTLLAPADHQRAEAMAAYNTALIAPLVARLAEQEQIIREQAEQVGALQARVQVQDDTIRALQAAQEAQEATREGHRTAQESGLTPMPSDPPAEYTDGRQPWWRRWWSALLATVLVLVASGMSCQPFGPG